MTTPAGQQPTVVNDPAQGADPDVAKYAELAKELGIEEGGAPEPVEPKPSEPSGLPAPAEPRRDRPEQVPYAEHENVQRALREARAAQKASDDRLAGIMQLVDQSLAKRGPHEPESKDNKPKLPDVHEDPIGFFQGRIAQLEAQLGEAHNGVRLTAEQQQSYQQHQALWQTVAHSEQDIRDPKNQNHKADYDDACQYLEGQRIKQLNRMYPDDSPRAVEYARSNGFQSAPELKLAILNQDRQSVAIQALQLGLSPAQFYYDLAMDAGYQLKPARAANGQFGAKAIEAAKRGKAASVSISGGASGRKGADDMSIADLADLFVEDPEMADRVWNQMARAGKLE